MQVKHRKTKLNYAIPIRTPPAKWWQIFSGPRHIATLGDAADHIARLGDGASAEHWIYAIEKLRAADADPSDSSHIIVACDAVRLALARDGDLAR